MIARDASIDYHSHASPCRLAGCSCRIRFPAACDACRSRRVPWLSSHPLHFWSSPSRSQVLRKVVRDVLAVAAKEMKRVRVIDFHRLRHIDDPHILLIVQQVVLGEIAVDQLAFLVHIAEQMNQSQVNAVVALLGQLDIFQSRGWPTILSQKLHHQHVSSQAVCLRHWKTGSIEATRLR